MAMSYFNSIVTIAIGFNLISFIVVSTAQPYTYNYEITERPKEYLFVSTTMMSWHKAIQYCRSQGMFLVSILNKEDFDDVKQAVHKSGHIEQHKILNMWTSLNDIDEEGSYHWASTGSQYTYSIWRTGEPNNIQHDNGMDEDCVALIHYPTYNVTYGLDDRRCDQKYHFMCETLDV